jgi:iron-sulfur cluster repair protein YtfE (RIC family)
MIDVNLYLTDEFSAFSAKIAKIHADKKAKEEEMKKVFTAFKAELKKFDEEALKAKQEWEQWAEDMANPKAATAK